MSHRCRYRHRIHRFVIFSQPIISTANGRSGSHGLTVQIFHQMPQGNRVDILSSFSFCAEFKEGKSFINGNIKLIKCRRRQRF